MIVEAPPTAPLLVTAVMDGSDATVTWKPPISDGGSPITEYDVTLVDIDDPQSKPRSCTTNGSDGDCVFRDLTDGDRYVAEVTATDDTGESREAVSTPVIG